MWIRKRPMRDREREIFSEAGTTIVKRGFQ